MSEFWAQRASTYTNLEWAHRGDRLSTFIRYAAPKPDDMVLDLGSGTGIVTRKLIGNVIGLDKSHEMVSISSADGGRYVLGDANHLPFPDATFDLVTARMVLHHIVDHTTLVLREAHRVLRGNGRICIAEGIPPSMRVAEWWNAVVTAGDGGSRLPISAGRICDMVIDAGFKYISTSIHVSPGCSIRNWLDNSVINNTVREELYTIHRNMDDDCISDYNAKITDEDVLIDMKYAIIVGYKEEV